MPEADAADLPLPPVRPDQGVGQKDYPLIEVGEFELNRNPDNYFAEVEQAAFTPANLVPGIGFSPDKMLQGRLFSYGDAARYRLGVNHHQIPVNSPRAAKLVNTYHRDGAMRVDGNQGGVTRHRAQQLRPLGRAARLRRAAAGDRCAPPTLRLPRGRRRLLHAARRPVPST